MNRIRRTIAASAVFAILGFGATALTTAAHATPPPPVTPSVATAGSGASGCHYLWISIAPNLPGLCV